MPKDKIVDPPMIILTNHYAMGCGQITITIPRTPPPRKKRNAAPATPAGDANEVVLGRKTTDPD